MLSTDHIIIIIIIYWNANCTECDGTIWRSGNARDFYTTIIILPIPCILI